MLLSLLPGKKNRHDGSGKTERQMTLVTDKAMKKLCLKVTNGNFKYKNSQEWLFTSLNLITRSSRALCSPLCEVRMDAEMDALRQGRDFWHSGVPKSRVKKQR